MRRLLLLALVFAVAISARAAAQVPDWVAQVIAAAQLPVTVADLRRDGVRDDEIRAVLDAMRGANVPAHDAKTLLDEERDARRQHGPVDNFGAFVQTKLAAGLRGRELAAAIRAEHAARGKGKGNVAGARGSEGTRGASGTKGKSPAAPGAARPSVTKGPPANAGKSKSAPASTKQKAPGTKGRPDKPNR